MKKVGDDDGVKFGRPSPLVWLNSYSLTIDNGVQYYDFTRPYGFIISFTKAV